MKNALEVYLQDHLAGSIFGIELVEALARETEDHSVAHQAAAWETEIKADQETLREIVNRLDASPVTLKNVVSWITEKATRLKLRRQNHSELGTLETLETLALGIVGKEKLWRSLRIALEGDPRFSDLNFDALEERARRQHDAVESARVAFASKVFRD